MIIMHNLVWQCALILSSGGSVVCRLSMPAGFTGKDIDRALHQLGWCRAKGWRQTDSGNYEARLRRL